MKSDDRVLFYSGLLGHPFAVTADDPRPGAGRRAIGECNDEATARRWASEHPNGRAWRKTKYGYKEVRP